MRLRPPLQPVKVFGVDIEVESKYKYLGLDLDNKLEWFVPDPEYQTNYTRSNLFLLRKLRCLDICSKMLKVFYQSMVTSVLFATSETICKENCQTSDKSFLCNWSETGHAGAGNGKTHVKDCPEQLSSPTL